MEKADTSRRDAGACLCQVDGQRLKRLRDTVTACNEKKLWWSMKEERALLEGNIVVQCVCTSSATDANMANDSSIASELWLHCSVLYLKPYRPAWHQFVRAPLGVDPGDGDGHGRVVLQAK